MVWQSHTGNVLNVALLRCVVPFKKLPCIAARCVWEWEAARPPQPCSRSFVPDAKRLRFQQGQQSLRSQLSPWLDFKLLKRLVTEKESFFVLRLRDLHLGF